VYVEFCFNLEYNLAVAYALTTRTMKTHTSRNAELGGGNTFEEYVKEAQELNLEQ
jgi:hypothetical protein